MKMIFDQKFLAASIGLCASSAIVPPFEATLSKPSPPAKVAKFDPKDVETDPGLRQEAFNAHCARIADEARREGVLIAAGGCLLASVVSAFTRREKTDKSGNN